ncbi:MAG: D-alanyl-D-alanine carboxypeptidase/D-alanyl-D-alanine-endopeptidase [Planctomycetota bacterium]
MAKRRKKIKLIKPNKSVVAIVIVAILGVATGLAAIALSDSGRAPAAGKTGAANANEKSSLTSNGNGSVAAAGSNNFNIRAAGYSPKTRSPKIAISSPVRTREIGAAGKAIDTILREIESTAPKKKGGVRPNAQTAFRAEALADGAVVTSHRSDQLLSGASNVKLFTTAAALLRLGPEFRFETRFVSDANLSDGVLKGDLWIIGGGDPTLTSQNGWCQGGAHGALMRAAAQLINQGIRRIDGAIVLDDRFFTDAAYHPGWPSRDRGRSHAIDISALCVERHRIEVTARANGNDVSVETDPPLAGWELDKNISVVSKNAAKGIVARIDGNSIRVSGTIAAGSADTTSFFILDGPELFGAVALSAFQNCNITVSGGYRKVGLLENAPRRVFVRLQSPATLAEVVKVTNRESDNLYADMLLKVLGAKCKGEGTFAAGIDAVRETLQNLGVPSAGFAAVDGSGLARDSKISPAATVALLQAMAETPVFDIYKDSLAVGGEPDGTLRKRFREPMYRGRIHAKTGSIDGATALSGYADAAGGETFAFSCITNYTEFGGTFKPDEDRCISEIIKIRSK